MYKYKNFGNGEPEELIEVGNVFSTLKELKSNKESVQKCLGTMLVIIAVGSIFCIGFIYFNQTSKDYVSGRYEFVSYSKSYQDFFKSLGWPAEFAIKILNSAHVEEWHKDNHHFIKQMEEHEHAPWHLLLEIGKRLNISNETCTNTKPNIIICKSGGQKISSIHQWHWLQFSKLAAINLKKMLGNMNKKTTCEFFQDGYVETIEFNFQEKQFEVKNFFQRIEPTPIQNNTFGLNEEDIILVTKDNPENSTAIPMISSPRLKNFSDPHPSTWNFSDPHYLGKIRSNLTELDLEK